jgi:hypothetical protein
MCNTIPTHLGQWANACARPVPEETMLKLTTPYMSHALSRANARRPCSYHALQTCNCQRKRCNQRHHLQHSWCVCAAMRLSCKTSTVAACRVCMRSSTSGKHSSTAASTFPTPTQLPAVPASHQQHTRKMSLSGCSHFRAPKLKTPTHQTVPTVDAPGHLVWPHKGAHCTHMVRPRDIHDVALSHNGSMKEKGITTQANMHCGAQ